MRYPFGVCVRHAALFLNDLEIRGRAVSAIDGPPRPPGQHRAELGFVQVNAAVAADTSRHAARQGRRQLALERLHRVVAQACANGPHAARDVEPDATGRHDPAFLRIECRHTADRESIAPVGIGHRVRRTLDAG